MDERLHSEDYFIIGVEHRGFTGGIHYYDVADGYGATLICHTNDESYHLEVPRHKNNEPLAKNFEELQEQWKCLINEFLIRHPDLDRNTGTKRNSDAHR